MIHVNSSIIERYDVTIRQTLGDVIEVTVSFLYYHMLKLPQNLTKNTSTSTQYLVLKESKSKI